MYYCWKAVTVFSVFRSPPSAMMNQRKKPLKFDMIVCSEKELHLTYGVRLSLVFTLSLIVL